MRRLWRETRSPDGKTTIIARWDVALGTGVGLGCASVLLLGGVQVSWGYWVALGVCAALASGFRYRVVIAPTGFTYSRSIFGVPWRRVRSPLSARVSIWSALENPDGEGVEIGDSIVLATRVGEAEQLFDRVKAAVGRAAGHVVTQRSSRGPKS